MNKYIKNINWHNLEIEDNNYSKIDNIVFIIELDKNNFKLINNRYILDYFLINVPYINVIIYTNNCSKFMRKVTKFLKKIKYNTNNIKIYNNMKSVKEQAIQYDKIFYTYINYFTFFSFQNWLYFIRFNNIIESYLFCENKMIDIFLINKKFITNELKSFRSINKNSNIKFNKDRDYNIRLFVDFNDKNKFNEFNKYYNELNSNNSKNINLNNNDHLKYLEICHKIYCNNYRILNDTNPNIIKNNISINEKFCEEELIKFEKNVILIGHAGWADVIHNSPVMRYLNKQFNKTYYFTYPHLIPILKYLYNDLDNIEFILFNCEDNKAFTILNKLSKDNIIISVGHQNRFDTYIDWFPNLETDDKIINNLKKKYKSLKIGECSKYNFTNYSIQQMWCNEKHMNISNSQNHFKINRIEEYENNLIDSIINNNLKSIDEHLGSANADNFDINKDYILIHDNSVNKIFEGQDTNINKKYLKYNNILNLSNISPNMLDIIKLLINDKLKEIHVINSIWLHILYLLKLRYSLIKVKIYVHQYCRPHRRGYKKSFLFPKLNDIIFIE